MYQWWVIILCKLKCKHKIKLCIIILFCSACYKFNFTQIFYPWLDQVKRISFVMDSRNFNFFVSHEKVSCRVYLGMNTKQGADSPWPGAGLNIPGRCCSEPGAWGGGASRQRAMSSSVAWQPMSDTCNTVDNANVDLWTSGGMMCSIMSVIVLILASAADIRQQHHNCALQTEEED